jgi:hypothetical protein
MQRRQQPASGGSQQAEAVRRVVRAEAAASWLRIAAIVVGILWLVTALAAFATAWHQLDLTEGNMSSLGPAGTSATWKLSTSLTLSGQASWGYAVAAAILFAASVWFTRQQALDALEALDDDEETEGGR